MPAVGDADIVKVASFSAMGRLPDVLADRQGDRATGLVDDKRQSARKP
jgi:hypothetical protein